MSPTKNFEDQIDELEQRYRSLVKDGQEQLEKMEDRYSDIVDRMEKQLPDDAADLLKRLRKANTDFRKQMARLREQAREATRDMIDAFKEAGERLPGSTPPKKKSATKKKSVSKAPSASWTKAELYEAATRLQISGRSKMSKQQLLNAVRKAG